MFIRFLRYIRNQPKAVRNQYALALAATFTAVVALVWVFTGMSIRSDAAYSDKVSKEDNVPFASLVNQVKNKWRDVTKSVETSNSEIDQVAAVSATDQTGSSTQTPGISLTAEEITEINNRQAKTNMQNPGTEIKPPAAYLEVQIATTSAAEATTTPVVVE